MRRERSDKVLMALLVLLVCAAALVWCSTVEIARADEPAGMAVRDGGPPPLDNYCTEARPMVPGDQANCIGVLITIPQAKSAVACKAVDLPSCYADLEATKAEHEDERSALLDRLEAQRRRAERAEALARDAASVEPVPRPWHQHPAFVATVSVAVTAGVAVLVWEVADR